jgi:hypothetical protein
MIGCAIIFASCVKQGVNPATVLGPSSKMVTSISASQLSGKWAVSKVDAYTLDMAGNQSNLVTYKQPLSDSNYVAFSRDSVCLWSADHYYAPGVKGNGIVHQNNFRKLTFHYSVSGISIDFWTPSGPTSVAESESATILSPNSIVIHSTYSTEDGNWAVADTYFSRP